MRLACITDPSTHPEFDTTVELYRRFALDPRIQLTHVSSQSILEPRIRGVVLDEPLEYNKFLKLEERSREINSLQDFDLIYCRSDKPLPDSYYLRLAEVENRVPFVNRPSSLLEVSKRQFIEQFARPYLPDFISTRSVTDAVKFISQFKTVVFKSSSSYGGKGVWKCALQGKIATIEHSSGGKQVFSSVEQACEHILGKDDLDFQLVRFLKNVHEGDKRILVVGEEILGGYLRKAREGSWINNITAGGSATLAAVSSAEKDIIMCTVGEFSRRGVHTLGYDFLMDDDESWILSEVNAGNIGGYNRLEQLSGEPIIDELILWLCNYSVTSKCV